LLGGATAWPLAARAQQPERVRRVGVLTSLTANDPESPDRLLAFTQALQQLGWTDGRNMQIDTRWGGGDAELNRKYAAELIALAPDVIFDTGSATVGPLLQATRAVPIVFTAAIRRWRTSKSPRTRCSSASAQRPSLLQSASRPRRADRPFLRLRRRSAGVRGMIR
jgi:ABC-type uncharacterized transport system substrate-binding protein